MENRIGARGDDRGRHRVQQYGVRDRREHHEPWASFWVDMSLRPLPKPGRSTPAPLRVRAKARLSQEALVGRARPRGLHRSKVQEVFTRSLEKSNASCVHSSGKRRLSCEVYRRRSRAVTSECVRLRKDREHSGRKPGTVECTRDTRAKLSRGRVGKSVGSNGYITSWDANPWVI